MNIIDPKQFETVSLNEVKISSVFDKFYQEKKGEFIQSYSELSDIEQFYTLSALVLSFSSVEMAKNLFLDELAHDLRILKVLNKPLLSNKGCEEIVEELYKKYPEYQSYWTSFVGETIDKFSEIAESVKNKNQK
jgi:hypothetical protein